ncbi:helix-turn-helix domain-containing protein [Actinomadura rupiterrae]|uniref:helix-turn-helix domain-containing protein n=1 Tax=Actinomadura rupiterrae TaxID=559627 RepID=UPI0020A38144|nr:helix-turn-helix transcriptional regulator [Actinomadura rupiterrae]
MPLRAALARHDMGAVLAIIRGSMGMTQLEFSQLAGWDQGSVSRIERGDRRTMDDIGEILRVWDVLEMPRQALLPMITGRVDATLSTEDEAAFWGGPDYSRREFGALVGAAAAGIALPQLANLPGRVDAGHVRFLRASLEQIRGQDRVIGGTGLLRQGQRLLERARAMLDECEYSTATGNELLVVTADLGIVTAWLAYDAGNQELARTLYNDAALLAHCSGDPELQVHAHANMAQQATYLARTTGRKGTAREALRFADQAAVAARHLPSATLQALIALRQALAHSELGDEIAFRRLIGRARDEVDRGRHDSDQSWTHFVGHSEITGYEAIGYGTLGRPERAAELYRRVLEDDRSPRDRAYYRARLAGSLAQVGDLSSAIDEGLAVLPQLVEGSLTSGRVLHELRPVRDAAAARAEEFRDQYDRAEAMLASA